MPRSRPPRTRTTGAAAGPRPRSARRGGTIALGILCSALGCARSVAPAADENGTIVVALQGDVDSWNPYTAHDAVSINLLDLLYPRLVVESGSPEGAIGFEPWLARSWSFSDDRLSLTFELRPDAVWSDGAPVTCDDVRFTHAMQISEELAWAGAFVKQRITGVDCPDAHTAVFRFREAYPDQLLDVNDNAIVPARYGEVPASEWASTAWEERFVGCGPLRLASVRRGQEAILERDPAWWDASRTTIGRVVLRVYPDSGAAFNRFLEGEVDLLPKVPPLRAADVERGARLRLVRLPSLSYTYLGWNMLAPGAYLEDRRERGCDEAGCVETVQDLRRLRREHPHPILADARVRRALSLAIDRADIVAGVWAGYARPGSSPVLSALGDAHDPAAALPYDPGRAAELLDAAGWRDADGDGVRERDGVALELEVIVNAENRTRRDALERVQAGLARIGVRIDERPLPRREFGTRARAKDFDAVLSGWWAGTRLELHNLLHGDAAVDRGNNLVSWFTPESDALLERARAAPAREDALPLWHAWQSLFVAEQPLSILYEEEQLVGLSARVRAERWSFLNPFQYLYRCRVAPRADGER